MSSKLSKISSFDGKNPSGISVSISSSGFAPVVLMYVSSNVNSISRGSSPIISFFSSVGVIKSSSETNSEFEKSTPKSSRFISSEVVDEPSFSSVEFDFGVASKSDIKSLKSMFSRFSKSGMSKEFDD